jgi:hypothetical protein
MRTEPEHPDRRRSRRKLIAVVVGAHVLGTLIARRQGYNMGGNVVVRCREGHRHAGETLGSDRR